ncbi:MAG: hypothetical protein GXP63_06885 [DPANN group archaeon]|nr:hypothetical protein [DPANN group archaeon]
MSMLSLSVAAVGSLRFEEVKIDGTVVTDVDSSTPIVLAREKDSKIEIRIELKSGEDLNDLDLEAVMRGYDHNDRIEDYVGAFDVDANVTYVKKMELKLPIRMDKDVYRLRIRADDRAGATFQRDYLVKIESDNHKLWLKDVIFNPESYVKAGRALLTTARIENIGQSDEDGLKVTASIPALGISASDYIDTLDEGDTITSEELYMRVPVCAEPGDYEVNIAVAYHDGDDTEKVTKTITVVEGDVCPSKIAPGDGSSEPATEKTIISIGATSQDVTAGQGGSIYPITLTNQGSSAKTYSVAVDVPGNWATYQVSPSNVAVVKSGETATMFVYISAKENAPAGENAFSVTVSGDGEELKQVLLKANVVGGEENETASASGWERVKNALEIGLVVLVVLLVILGLVIGFQRLKGDEGDDMGKTYY